MYLSSVYFIHAEGLTIDISILQLVDIWYLVNIYWRSWSRTCPDHYKVSRKEWNNIWPNTQLSKTCFLVAICTVHWYWLAHFIPAYCFMVFTFFSASLISWSLYFHVAILSKRYKCLKRNARLDPLKDISYQIPLPLLDKINLNIVRVDQQIDSSQHLHDESKCPKCVFVQDK